MNRRQKIIVSITGITLISLFLIALTYGYYVTKIKGNTKDTSINLITDNLELVYGDDDGSIIGAGQLITPNTTFDPKTFSVENKGKSTVEYSVVLDNVSITNASTGDETSFESNDFVYTLTCTSGCNGVGTETTLPLYNNGILVSNSIEEGEKQTYSITITYKDTGVDQSADMNKSLSARINIADLKEVNPYRDKNTLAYNIINNALNVSSTEKEKNYAEFSKTSISGVGTSISGKNYTTSITESADKMTFSDDAYVFSYFMYADDYTVDEKNGFTLTGIHNCKYSECYSNLAGKYLVSNGPGANSGNIGVDLIKSSTGLESIYKVATAGTSATSSVSLTKYTISTIDIDESILTMADDDYGTSYYYRGNVKNNYVSFAEMCWRIVRIAGDGSIKLILEDQYEKCSDNMDGDWNISSSTVSYGYEVENSIYKINYKYGGMASEFKSFQTSKLNEYTDKLKAGDWCYDDTAYQDLAGTIPISDTSSYYKTANSSFYYGTYTRLNNKKEPTLKCAGTNMTKFVDGTTDMYVGTLTVDDIVFAGGMYYPSNENYYLVNTYQQTNNINWWTLSPYWFNGNDNAYFATSDGRLYGGIVASSKVSFTYKNIRPAISLASGTLISGGNGSIDDPYTVE